jgi:hypothetical protein
LKRGVTTSAPGQQRRRAQAERAGLGAVEVHVARADRDLAITGRIRELTSCTGKPRSADMFKPVS